ncbi:MAG: immunoglobulin domain-containing protein [Enterobacterales bacterium]|uniref:immunoglobulin domain-containing protein n=1 Tax=Hafniaceae TaxID=1903412 RepID=UPI00197E044B|nr:MULTISPECIES: immunoglobulin domain-containing protein [Hafniaceae]MDN5969883.1 immunoglobulin domain-containing protein [Enterobacterales bacterium]MCE9886564.1 immunoglobulin domain-containing protein [Obesumbacterium proteus]MCE9918124.1 immunoglobulin domain-containing protein [Obesumbacterium proteus]MCE9931233.1 immunoglobulin domain-containing protein [Obesumbacterium proteus]MCG2878721.1 immunoglobulin domain-containing protein [Obesumbacterium proteus]
MINVSAQPTGATLAVGDALNLSVTASASDGAALSYQWFKDGKAVPGANANTLTKASVTASDAGTYHVVISSAALMPVTSSDAVIAIS